MTDKVKRVMSELNISRSVAEELLTLAGNDTSMVIRASRKSNGLNQCKASIIGNRLFNIENRIEGIEDELETY